MAPIPARCPARDRAGEGEESHVGQAGEQEEGHRATGDLAARHAPAAQDPGAESQPSGASYREKRVGGQLGKTDLRTRLPTHVSAKDEAKGEDV